jgi:glycosyltransferase involved in cell wall biosynthesis
MHSSLPQQLENFDFSRSLLLKRIFVWIEHFILKNSQAVIAICPDLQQKVKKAGWGAKAILLENILDFDYPCFSPEEIREKRREFAADTDPIVLYAGNFQPYQGISLLLEAAAQMHNQRAVFVVVGDTASAVQKMRLKTRDLNITDKVHFTGQVDPALMPLYLAIADVLVSPRVSGTNTPLKIYSFLKTGKPVVATNLWTHTQILNEKISILTEPEAASLAAGITLALNDQEAQVRAQTARELAERDYTFPKYLEKIRQVLDKASSRSGNN